MHSDQTTGHMGRQDQQAPMTGRKRYRLGEVATKLRQVDTLISQGMLVTKAIRRIGVSDSTYYRWRADYQALVEQVRPNLNQAERLRRLEAENTRLRWVLADIMLERQVLKEAAFEAT